MSDATTQTDIGQPDTRLEPTESLQETALAAFDNYEEKDKKHEPAKPEKEPEAPAETEPEKEERPDAEAEGETAPEATEEPGDGEGYYADEDVEDEGAPEETPEQVKDEWKNLSPLQRYLVENIQPLIIQGTLNGKETSLEVYAVENIPDSFEFASHGAERQAMALLDRMERKAEQLQQQFESNRQQQDNQKYADQENRDIQLDIAELQREGKLPLFTRGTNVDDDPRAQLARDVLDYYNKENTRRLEAAQRQGRMYHHLSYYDAYEKYVAQNPQTTKEQRAEDAERKEITRRSARSQRQGATQKDGKKLQLPRTASWDQVINAALGVLTPLH